MRAIASAAKRSRDAGARQHSYVAMRIRPLRRRPAANVIVVAAFTVLAVPDLIDLAVIPV